jgi:two-component system, sensor histidine kinase and response regulator
MNSNPTETRILLENCRILLVEDDEGDAGLVTWALKRQAEFPYVLRHVETLDDCLSACERQEYDVILLDLTLPGSSRLNTVRTVTQSVSTPVVVFTGLDDRQTALEALQAGAQDYLVKQNVNPHEICRSIRYAMERKQARDFLVRLREDFLTHVSHEFRTPVTAAAGAIELLQDLVTSETTPMEAGLIAMAANNLLLLRVMIGDLVDTTMAYSGKLFMHKRSSSVGTLVTPLLEAMTLSAQRKGLQLTSELNTDIHVHADPERVTQVLTNLISNAIKFTPEGGTISVAVDHSTTQDGRVLFTVSDTGRGIPDEARPFLFERLYQAPQDPASGSRNGLGLGLYISRELIHAHGGELQVTSKLGEGSSFSFTLDGARKNNRVTLRE